VHGEVSASPTVDIAWVDLPQQLPGHGRPADAGVTGQGISSVMASPRRRSRRPGQAGAVRAGTPRPLLRRLPRPRRPVSTLSVACLEPPRVMDQEPELAATYVDLVAGIAPVKTRTRRG
jgi:hypothetical protein